MYLEPKIPELQEKPTGIWLQISSLILLLSFSLLTLDVSPVFAQPGSAPSRICTMETLTHEKEYQLHIAGKLSDSTNINVILSLDKNFFLEAEDIILNIKIKNNGLNIDSIKNLDGHSFSTNINLTNSGSKLPYTGMEMYGPGGDYVHLLPGQEIDFSFDLLNTYGTKKQESIFPSNSVYLPQGSYNISLLPNNWLFGKDLHSNNLSFEIKYPTGFENGALIELRELYKLSPSTDLSLKYREFVYKYPESAYMDQSFVDFLSIRLGEQEKKYSNLIIEDCKWFIGNRPNSSYVKLILKNCIELLEKYESKSNAEEYLNKVATLYSSAKVGKEALQLLDKLNE